MMERFPGIRRAFRLGVAARELDEELAFHFQETREELLAQGCSPEEAEREAHRRFGDERHYRRRLERIDGRAAATRRWRHRWEVGRDSVRQALRRMRRAPGLTLGVVLTFALGIGANAAMFGIVDRLLLSPPAHVEDAGQVRRLMVERRSPLTGTREPIEALSFPDYEALSAVEAFAGLAAVGEQELTLGQGAEAGPVEARLVTANFFSLLGVRAALGRFLLSEDPRPDAPGVAVISHALWRQEFGGNGGVLGRTIDFGHGPYAIVGVAPDGFTGVDLERVDLWLPLQQAQSAIVGAAEAGQKWRGPGWLWLRIVARLARDASVEEAEAQATVVNRMVRAESIERGYYDSQARMLATSLIAARGPRASDESAVAKWLAAVSLIVLLIACANIANLLLARAFRQQREIGIRLALGSSRGRIMGQVVIESVLLALAGGAAALLVTHWGGTLVRKVLLPEIAWGASPLYGRTLGVIVALSLLAGAVSGLVPAAQSVRRDVREFIGGSSRAAPPGTSRWRSALTVLQAALSVVLLVGAGLFVRSLHRVQTLDFGIDPAGVFYVKPVFEKGIGGPLDDPAVAALYQRALERLVQHPVVEHAAVVDAAPFQMVMGQSVRVPGRDSVPTLPGGGPYRQSVSMGYFSALGLRILRGRGFAGADQTEGAPATVVVDETTARTLWPGENAVGQCVLLGGAESSCTTVIGVVENARRSRIVGEAAAMNLYQPLPPERFGLARVLLLRARGDPRQVVPAIRRELLALEPRLRFAQVEPLEEIIAPQMRSWRLGASVLSAFGALAMVVAGIGLYSVLAFGVARRTRELGIRAALGASAARLRAMVVREGVRLVMFGAAVGLSAALLVAPRIESLLFGVGPRDPLVLGSVTALLVLVALAASWIPAWRATRVDPSGALRAE